MGQCRIWEYNYYVGTFGGVHDGGRAAVADELIHLPRKAAGVCGV